MGDGWGHEPAGRPGFGRVVEVVGEEVGEEVGRRVRDVSDRTNRLMRVGY